VWAPAFPSIFPAGGPSAALSDVFFLLQKLPTLSHKANACGINQLSALSEWVCEIAIYQCEWENVRGSARMMACVLNIFGGLNRNIMAMKCELCGKGPHFGNVISHANNTRRRRWNPNLRRVRGLVNGAKKQMRVCAACIRAGRVKKAA
jgi:large subunit ribosomal protein L28